MYFTPDLKAQKSSPLQPDRYSATATASYDPFVPSTEATSISDPNAIEVSGGTKQYVKRSELSFKPQTFPDYELVEHHPFSRPRYELPQRIFKSHDEV